MGDLFITSSGGGVLEVPPGGGPVTVVLTPAQVHENGFLGPPLVMTDNSLLVQGADSSQTTAVIYRYVPSTAGLQMWATDPRGSYYGRSLVQDANGSVLSLGSGTIFSSDGTMSQAANWLSIYAVIGPTAFYVESGGTAIEKLCFDGSHSTPYASGITDGYGLAIGSDGALYSSQGNTNPATVWKVPPGGGTAISFATVPMDVVTVEADPSGPYIYLAGSLDGNTVWRVDTSTGAKVVYGCDSKGSTRACGSTM
jgi:hypothetical protein